MNPQRLRRVEEVFVAVVGGGDDQPAHSANLTALCDGDESLRAEVETLLRHHRDAIGDSAQGAELSSNEEDHDDSTGRFLNPKELRGERGDRLHLGAHELVPEWAAAGAGARIGGYTIIGSIGSGGMGVVYVAEQDRPRRTVALKLIRHAVATPGMIRRFEREAEVLGRLSHPGIAQIYEAGVAELDHSKTASSPNAPPHGPALVPFIAMELVRGPNLLEHVRVTRAGPRECLELVARVRDAVQHAHQRGFIHRDLKPANVLVDPAGHSPDSGPQPKVLDFGVARAVGDTQGYMTHSAHSAITLDGQMIGTLPYMSPEQVSGASRDAVDTRTDVYALGAMLFHLLAGRPPHGAEPMPIPQLARKICEEDAPLLGSIQPDLRGEIETIVRKAIERDKDRRYQSAAELCEDLRRYLRGEPIAARQDSALYMLRKQIKRHRGLVAVAGLGLATLVLFAIYATFQAQKQAETAHIAVQSLNESRAQRDRADSAAAQLAQELSASRIEQGRLLGAGGDMRSAEELIWREHLQHPDSVRSRWALWELYSRYPCERTILAHDGYVRCVAWRPDGAALATGGDDGAVRIWDPRTGARLLEIRTSHRSNQTMTFAGDGGALLVSAGDDGPIDVWDAHTGAPVRQLDGHKGPATCLALSPDGQFLVSGGRDGQVIVWRMPDGEIVSACTVQDSHGNAIPVRSVRVDPTSTRVAAGTDDGLARVWGLPRGLGKTEPLIFKGHRYAVSSVTFSPDGAQLFTGSGDRTMKVWDASTGALVRSVDSSNGTVRDIECSPDRKTLATVGWWRVDLWDAQTLERVRPSGADPVGGYGATEAKFSPDGKGLAIAGGMGAVRVWSMDPGAGTETLRGHTNVVVATAAVRQANQILLVSTGNDGLINIWTRPVDGVTGPGGWTSRAPIKSPYTNRAMSLSDDGTLVAASGFDGSVNLWETATGTQVAHLLGHRANTAALAFTHDGTRLISGSADQTLRIWHLDPSDRQWKFERLIENQPGETLGISVSRDDRIAVTSHRGAVARFWSLPDGNLIAVRPTASAVWLPAFAPHGDRVAVGCWDRAAELWDLTPLRRRVAAPTTVPSTDVAPRQAAYLGHTQLVSGVAVSEDGSLLASASQDGLVRIFDATAGVERPTDEPQQSLVTLDAHGGEAFQVVFLPPPLGHLVAAGYHDGAVRVFDLSHFDRHIAGQFEYQIAIKEKDLAERIDRAALRRWAASLKPQAPATQP